MSSQRSAREIAPWLYALVIVAAVVLAYVPALHAPFLFDDGASIARNPSIRHLGDLGAVFSPPAGGEGVTGRPIVNLSLAVDYAIGGLAVEGYHATNIAIHALAALALFGFVRRTLLLPRFAARFDGSATGVAFAAALLWAVHPLATESVTCVIQRTESLLGLFYFVAFYAFARAVGASSRSNAWKLLSVLSCAVGMATKEVMVTAPVLIWLYDALLVGRSFSQPLRGRRGFYSALAATWLVLVLLLVRMGGSRGDAAGFGLGMPWWTYTLKQCEAIVRYFGLSVWPHPLVLDYGTDVVRSIVPVLPQGLLIIAALTLTAGGILRRNVWAFIGAWFFVILAPSSSVVPLVTQTVAEHRMYLPLAALCAAAAIGAFLMIGRRIGAGLCVVIAIALGLTTLARNRVYRSELSIWQDTVAKQPANWRAHTDYGNALLGAKQLAPAAAQYEMALAINPGGFEAHANLAGVRVQQERYADAIAEAKRALELKPGYPIAENNLANALVKTGRPAEALVHAQMALAARAEFPEAELNVAIALAELGRAAEALPHCEAALRQMANVAGAHFAYASALYQLGRWPEARTEFEAALRLDPDYADASDGLGSVLFRLGDVPGAATRYAAAVKLRPQDASMRANLGAALYQLGRLPEAIEQLEAAVRQDPRNLNAQNNLGATCLATGRTAEAVTAFRAAVQLKSDPATTRNLIGALYQDGLARTRAGDVKGAEEALREAVRLAPDFTEAHEALGKLFWSQGRASEAAAEMSTAKKAAPTGP